MIARLHPQKGHTCFEMNIETGVIVAAEFEAVDANITRLNEAAAVTKKLMVKKGCMYTTALNKENAFKKFVRALQ